MTDKPTPLHDAALETIGGGFTATDDLFKVLDHDTAKASKDMVLKGKKILQN